MGPYDTPLQKPREPLWRRVVLLRLWRANGWVMAGLLLAQGMAALLYLVMVDNLAQVDSQRQAEVQRARQRHACTLLARRLAREQCVAALADAQSTEGPAASASAW